MSVITLALLVLALSHGLAVAQTGKANATSELPARELVTDPRFQNGLTLLDPAPGKIVPYGKVAGPIAGPPPQEPVWQLAQWASKYPLKAEAPLGLTGGAVRYSNEGKAIVIGSPQSGEADFSLAVNGKAEYGPQARKNGEPWVHLLVQQGFAHPPSLDNLAGIDFHIEAKLKQSRLSRTNDYTPTLHAAQFQIFLSIQNLNHRSPGYGKYLWFGIPIYDDRERSPKGAAAKDKGTGMYIFSTPSAKFTSRSAHDKDWISLNADLLPLVRKGLETAWTNDFLTESKSESDYFVAGMNMGWEVPGVFDVDMQVRNLSIKVHEKSESPVP